MTDIDTAALRELLKEATPGPVAWFGNGSAQRISLATTHSGRRFVMSFYRWGMRGVQPAFPVDGVMTNASTMLKFAVGDPSVTGMEEAEADSTVYRYDIVDIDNVEARLLVAARNAAPALLDRIEALETALRDIETMPLPKNAGSDAHHLRAVATRALGASR